MYHAEQMNYTNKLIEVLELLESIRFPVVQLPFLFTPLMKSFLLPVLGPFGAIGFDSRTFGQGRLVIIFIIEMVPFGHGEVGHIDFNLGDVRSLLRLDELLNFSPPVGSFLLGLFPIPHQLVDALLKPALFLGFFGFFGGITLGRSGRQFRFLFFDLYGLFCFQVAFYLSSFNLIFGFHTLISLADLRRFTPRLGGIWSGQRKREANLVVWHQTASLQSLLASPFKLAGLKEEPDFLLFT
jgi:hypothetical protein